MNNDQVQDNYNDYERLLVSVQASRETLSLFIAVFDNVTLRDEIIHRYIDELTPEFVSYEISLSPINSSLAAAIANLQDTDIFLRHGVKAVFTIIGVEGFNEIEQNDFVKRLQWTRRRIAEFNFPIIVWLNHSALDKLIRFAPEFWNWRSGLFDFTSIQISSLKCNEYAQHESQEMSIQEIERAYYGEWVVVRVTAFEHGFPGQGEVLLHGKEISQIAAHVDRDMSNLYIFFCGEINL